MKNFKIGFSCFLFHELGRYNYTVGCDIHNYIFMKENFLIKFVKIYYSYYSIS